MDWRDIPSLPALRAFEAAARTGSLTKAAAELNVTHAAIAQHVRTVEDIIGTPLLTRAGRGMALTDKGAQLAGPLTDSLSQIITTVRQMTQDQQDAPLSITTTPIFAENWLMPRLGPFWAAHPNITLSITPSFELADLRRDGFDMAIRYGNGNWPGLTTTYLASADYVVVAAPDLIGDRKVTSLKDITDIPWLHEAMHRESQLWAENNGLDQSCCQLKSLPTLTMVLSATRAGAGISIQSRALIETDLKNGTLVSILTAPQENLGYHIVTRPGVQSAKLKTFVKWLRSA